MTGDVQPLVRFNVSCLSERETERQTARSGGGGRMGMAYFDTHTPEDIARDAARQAVLLQSAVEAPAGTFPVVLAAGDSGILLHEAIGHGLEADFNRKKTSNYIGPHRRARRLRRCARSSTTARLPTAAARSTSTTRATCRRYNVLIENGILQAYLQDRISAKRHGHASPPATAAAQSFKHYPMPRMTNTYMLAGQTAPEEIIRRRRQGHLLRRVHRRPGEHQQRRLRLQRDRGLHDRGRQDHGADPQRQPHRQRPGRADEGDAPSATTSRCQRRALDLRQGRAERCRSASASRPCSSRA